MELFDKGGNPISLDDVPVHCQVDECDYFVDRSADPLTYKADPWPFRIWLWFCPKHVGMVVATADRVFDER